MDSGWREADTPSLTGKGLRQRLTACEFKLSDIVVFVDFTLAPFLVLMKTQMAESTQDIVTVVNKLPVQRSSGQLVSDDMADEKYKYGTGNQLEIAVADFEYPETLRAMPCAPLAADILRGLEQQAQDRDRSLWEALREDWRFVLASAPFILSV